MMYGMAKIADFALSKIQPPLTRNHSRPLTFSLLFLYFIRSIYLYKATSPNQNKKKTGFLNPEVITADTHMDMDINVIIYMTEALKGYDFFVALYLHNGHHVLLSICPKHGRGFILDSDKWEKKKTKDDYYLINQVERVVGCWTFELGASYCKFPKRTLGNVDLCHDVDA